MPKGYWIVRVDVTDPDAYKAYVAANGPVFAKFGAHFVIRAGRFETLEGSSRARNVVIEFPSYETALACWRSPEYQQVMALRTTAGIADLVIIEGYEGPQPTLSSLAGLMLAGLVAFFALGSSDADAKQQTPPQPRWKGQPVQVAPAHRQPSATRWMARCRVPLETEAEKAQVSAARRLCSNLVVEERGEGTSEGNGGQ